jgi:hypothetical protein
MPPKRKIAEGSHGHHGSDSESGDAQAQQSPSDSEETGEDLEPVFTYRITHFNVPEGGDDKGIKQDLICSLKKFQKSVRQWKKRGEKVDALGRLLVQARHLVLRIEPDMSVKNAAKHPLFMSKFFSSTKH